MRGSVSGGWCVLDTTAGEWVGTAKGRRVQYEQFVRDRQRPLFRFAVVLTGDPVLAEEIVQSVFARCYERWQLVAAADDANAYVRRMVVNEYIGWRRRNRRSVSVAEFTGLVEDALPQVPDPAAGRADRIDLSAQLSTLPPQQRAALVLRFYIGLSFAEVARSLGCRESSARGYVTRALSTLRIQMTAPLAAPGRER